MKHMTQLAEVIPSLPSFIDIFLEDIAEKKRDFAGQMMSAFPDRRGLDRLAKGLKKSLQAGGIEINAVTQEHLTTVGSAPMLNRPMTLPCSTSLCVVTVHEGKPIAVDDVAHDPALEGHPARAFVTSWASAPVWVNGVAAGTVCATENVRTREWRTRDELALQVCAQEVGDRIQNWLSLEPTSARLGRLR